MQSKFFEAVTDLNRSYLSNAVRFFQMSGDAINRQLGAAPSAFNVNNQSTEDQGAFAAISPFADVTTDLIKKSARAGSELMAATAQDFGRVTDSIAKMQERARYFATRETTRAEEVQVRRRDF